MSKTEEQIEAIKRGIAILDERRRAAWKEETDWRIRRVELNRRIQTLKMELPVEPEINPKRALVRDILIGIGFCDSWETIRADDRSAVFRLVDVRTDILQAIRDELVAARSLAIEVAQLRKETVE